MKPTVLWYLSVAGISGCDLLQSPVLTPPRVPAQVIVADGKDQSVIVGAISFRPLIVRVATADGAAVPNVDVHWSVDPGGRLLTYPDRHAMQGSVTSTDKYGQAGVYLHALAVGIIRVSAATPGVDGAATFDIAATSQHDITVYVSSGLCGWPSTFHNGRRLDSTHVNVGAIVTFEVTYDLNGDVCRTKLASIDVPEGGEAVATDTLRSGEQFRFSPQVQGTWLIRDVLNGGELRLTAKTP
jgi:hypothetical protein